MQRPSGWGVYVHIPWCAIRCPYCAFAVDARRDRPEAAYTDAILRQWASERAFVSGRPDSVYFGGGTPSQADPAELARVLRAIDPPAGAEITAEVNPGKLDAGRLDALAGIGVNRVSLGVQSFVPEVARRLGRAHSCREAEEVWAQARRVGFRSISLDLIFAVPGQTLADFDADLDRVLDAPPDHVSVYGLTIEPGTPFERAGYAPTAESEADARDELWRRMYERATERLAASGLHAYEVSNFAAAGHRSVHNGHYWRARSWIGLGASAHGCRPPQARRTVRTRTQPGVDAYIADPSPVEEVVQPEDLLAELVGSTLRHVDGVDLDSLAERTGFRLCPPEPLLRAGVLVEDGAALRLDPAHFPVADFIAARLCDTRKPT